jgi:hypothetical protein
MKSIDTTKALSSNVIRAQGRAAAPRRRHHGHLHRHLFTVLMDREWTHGVPTAVDVTLLSRY